MAEEIALAIRDRLLPLADIASPNRFELEYLSGTPCTSFDSSIMASTHLGADTVLASSIPSEGNWAEGNLTTLCCAGSEVFSRTTARLSHVPKGTGDLLIALYLGHRLNGLDVSRCLNLAVDATFEICRQSAAARAEELMLVANRKLLITTP